jgi:hypothetical protein
MQRTFPKAKSQAAYSIHRRDGNRNKPQAIKEGAAVLALAHSDFCSVNIARRTMTKQGLLTLGMLGK